MNSQSAQDFPNNVTGSITPAIMRTFVANLIASYQQFADVSSQPGSGYTIVASDYGKVVKLTNSAAVAVTLPTATGSFYPFSFYIAPTGAGGATLTPATGTINGASNLFVAKNYNAFVISDGANWQAIVSQFIGTSDLVQFGGLGLGGPAQGIGRLSLYGSTSGHIDLKAPAIAGTNSITFPAGTTDFSSTGGTSQFLKQNSLGGAIAAVQPTTTDVAFTQSGSGAVLRTLQTKLTETVSVKDFGATGNGSTDDTTAVAAAMASLSSGGTLNFPTGTYKISAEIAGLSNVEIACDNATIISSTVIRSYFYFDTKTNNYIHGCTFNQNQPNLPVYTDGTRQPKNVALIFESSSNIRIYGNAFTNLYTNAMYFHGSSGVLRIENNNFTSATPNQSLLYEHINILTFVGQASVNSNNFNNETNTNPALGVASALVYGVVGNITFSDNAMNYCGRDNTNGHRVGCIDFYGTSQNIVLSGNTATNILEQFSRLNSSWPAKIFSNTLELDASASVSQPSTISLEGTITHLGDGGLIGTKRIDIYDNVMKANSDGHTGVAIIGYDWSEPSSFIKVYNNTFLDYKYPLQLSGPYNDIELTGNSISGQYYGQIRVISDVANITAANGVSQAQGSYWGLLIADNKLVQTAAVSAAGISVDFTDTPAFTGTVGDIKVARNQVRAVPAGTTAVRLVTNTSKGIVTAIDNTIYNWVTGILIQGWNAVTYNQNQFNTVTTNISTALNTTESAVYQYTDQFQVTVSGANKLDYGITSSGKWAITGAANFSSTIGMLDTSAAHYVNLTATSSSALTADRALVFDLVNAARTIKLQGNLDIGGTLTTYGAASLPAIAQGDLWYGSATGVVSALAKNTSTTRYLANNGTSNNPAWAQIDLPTGVAGTLPSGSFPALTGDVNTALGSTNTVVVKVNGVAYGTSPSTNTVPVVTGANTVTYEAVPNAALANSSTTLNTGTNFGITAPGGMSLGSTYTIGATTDNLRFNGLGLGVAAPTTAGQISSVLGANNVTAINIKRATDTSPTGSFLVFQNAAASTVFSISITGSIDNGSWAGTAIPVNRGGCGGDLSATGGTSQVLKQTSVGANCTVAQLSNSDISGLGTMATQNASAVAIAGGTIAGLTGFGIRSTGAAFDLTIASTEVFTAGRTLTVALNNSARALTISADATISGTNTGDGNVATTSTTTSASFYPLFVASSTNSTQAVNLGTGLSFNPSTNVLTTTTFSGALSGNATTATTATNGATVSTSSNATFYPLFAASSSNGNQPFNLGTGLTYNPSTAGIGLSGTAPAVTLNNSSTVLADNSVVGNFDFYTNDGSSGGVGVAARVSAITEASSFGVDQAITFSTRHASDSGVLTEFMRLSALGKLSLVATTDATTSTGGNFTNAGGMSVAKRVWIPGITTSAGLQTAVLCQSSGGEMIADSVACLASAARYKEGFANISDEQALASVLAMQPKSWRYIRDPDSIFHDEYYRQRIGLVADDLVVIDRRLANFNRNGLVQGDDYNAVVTLQAGAIRALKAEIEELKRAIVR